MPPQVTADSLRELNAERRRHRETLALLAEYAQRAIVITAGGTAATDRCKVCVHPPMGAGPNFQVTCPCRRALKYIADQQARLAGDVEPVEIAPGLPPAPAKKFGDPAGRRFGDVPRE